jgi:rhodanese-related sulfurtransferase
MSDAAPEQAPEVGFDELATALQEGKVVVDVRERHEYERAHVAGVRLIPMSELEQRWEEIPAGDRVYLICQSGARSLNAATALRQVGVDAVSVAGGTGGWAKEGRPVESGPRPAESRE